MRLSATRMFRRIALTGVIAGLAFPWLAGPPAAAEAEKPYASPMAAYNLGIAAWREERLDKAVAALEFAAGKGVLDAQLKLAEFYATGNGVPQSDAKSFGYYQRIANRFADVSPRHPVAEHVAEAFVALAGYHRKGLAELNVKPDPARAVRLYRHAASYFGDVNAQHALAGMYLDGEGVNRNVRLAINWLTNAAEKQHAPSQARLGDLLWRGVDDYHQPLRGLALLALARENAVGTEDQAWIEELYARAAGEAGAEQREQAGRMASDWHSGTGGGTGGGGVSRADESKRAGDDTSGSDREAAVAADDSGGAKTAQKTR